MRSLFRRALLALALILFLVAVPLSASAAETETSELIIVTEDDVVAGDLYGAANRVLIRGRVEGDLMAVAGQDIRIEGEVTGSVIALAPEVVVTGRVGGSLRVVSPQVTVDGSIGRDVFASAGKFELSSIGSVDGDVVVWAWNVDSGGVIGGRLEGSQRSLSLSGQIDGDVAVSVTWLTISGPLVVGGDLNYRSAHDATGLDNADVDGAIVQQDPLPPNIRLRALGFVGRLLIATVLSAIALLVAWGWPDRTERALEGFKSYPIRSYLVGSAVMFSPVLMIGLATLIYSLAPPAAALPLIATMVPLILALSGLVFVLALVAGIPFVAWLGSAIRKQLTIAGAVGIGAVVVSFIWLIPQVGWLVPLLIGTGGLGGWVQSFRRPESDTSPA